MPSGPSDQTPPHRPTAADRLAVAAVPTLLLAVAGVQAVLVHAGGLSPWKGGGFGMFSTVDAPDLRSVVGTVAVDGRAVPTHPAASWPDEAEAAVTLPTVANLRRLAEAMRAASWRTPDDPDGDARPAGAVSVEVRRMTYSAATGRAATVALRTASADGRP